MKRGVSKEKLLALADFNNSDLFNSKEKAALNYAEAVTYSDREPTDEHFDELAKHFDDDGIVELTGLIAFQNMSSKFNAALDVAPQGFCEIPQQTKG
jgi:alkylhydroperoxidase family enzyme